jgi:hypothetical protein
VAAFGGTDLIALAIPDEKSLPQAGAGGEQGARTARLRRAGIENREISGIEIFNTVAPCAEVIQKNDVFDVEFLGKHGGIDGPGKIGGADPIVNDRTSDAETSGADFFVAQVRGGYAGKLFGDKIESGEILAAEPLLENGNEPAALFRKKREVAFGAADITGQYHESPQEKRENKIMQRQRNNRARLLNSPGA